MARNQTCADLALSILFVVSGKMTCPNSQGRLQGHTSKASAGEDADPKLSSCKSLQGLGGWLFVGGSTPACEDAIFFLNCYVS